MMVKKHMNSKINFQKKLINYIYFGCKISSNHKINLKLKKRFQKGEKEINLIHQLKIRIQLKKRLLNR